MKLILNALLPIIMFIVVALPSPNVRPVSHMVDNIDPQPNVRPISHNVGLTLSQEELSVR
jgi:hypothetical protein